MQSLTIDLVSNASAQPSPDKTLSSFTNFSPKQLNLEGQWEVAISEISHQSLYQNVTERNPCFFVRKFSKMSEFYYLDPGLYSSSADIVEAMNTLFQETNHSESCITVEVSLRTKTLRLTLKMMYLVLHSLVQT